MLRTAAATALLFSTLAAQASDTAGDQKPTGILKLVSPSPSVTHGSFPPTRDQPMRNRDELMPLARQIAENADFMKRFRGVIGSGNKDRARDMLDELIEYARTIDPKLTLAEGTMLALMLATIFDDEPHGPRAPQPKSP